MPDQVKSVWGCPKCPTTYTSLVSLSATPMHICPNPMGKHKPLVLQEGERPVDIGVTKTKVEPKPIPKPVTKPPVAAVRVRPKRLTK